LIPQAREDILHWAIFTIAAGRFQVDFHNSLRHKGLRQRGSQCDRRLRQNSRTIAVVAKRVQQRV
jgi:hypothetical protein